MRHSFFVLLFILLIFIAIIHYLGLALFWYGQFAFLDLVTHFLGGFWVSGMALWFFFVFLIRFRRAGKKTLCGVALGAILVIGIGWEIFEYNIREPLFFISKEEYITDTAIDLAIGILGALAALWYFLQKRYATEKSISDFRL